MTQRTSGNESWSAKIQPPSGKRKLLLCSKQIITFFSCLQSNNVAFSAKGNPPSHHWFTDVTTNTVKVGTVGGEAWYSHSYSKQGWACFAQSQTSSHDQNAATFRDWDILQHIHFLSSHRWVLYVILNILFCVRCHRVIKLCEVKKKGTTMRKNNARRREPTKSNNKQTENGRLTVGCHPFPYSPLVRWSRKADDERTYRTDCITSWMWIFEYAPFRKSNMPLPESLNFRNSKPSKIDVAEGLQDPTYFFGKRFRH